MDQDALKVVEAFRRALMVRSASVSKRALSWYEGVDMSRPAAGAQLASRLMPEWRASADLGIAFYRLYAALMTGRTVDSPLAKKRQKRVTMGELVADFEKASGVRLSGLRAASKRSVKSDPGLSVGMLERTFKANSASAVTQFERRWQRRLESPGGAGARDGDRAWYAGVAQQIVGNGARDVAAQMGAADSRLLGWVRVSGSGSPCAFCAMLISRGIGWLPYKSKASAGGARDYHPHCKCYPLPVYSEKEFKSGQQFAQSRQLEKVWQSEFGGGSVSEWRKFYDARYGVGKEK